MRGVDFADLIVYLLHHEFGDKVEPAKCFAVTLIMVWDLKPAFYGSVGSIRLHLMPENI